VNGKYVLYSHPASQKAQFFKKQISQLKIEFFQLKFGWKNKNNYFRTPVQNAGDAS
jgi:hypothetical protein